MIIVCVFLFCIPVTMGAEKDEGFITRIGRCFDGTNTCECPECPALQNGVVCPEMKLKEIKRPAFEIEARLDGFTTPTGGPAQFRAENFTFTGKHNFSPVLNVYGSYGVMTVDKTEYDGSLYHKTWSYQTIMAGVGWYVHPIIEIFAGVGKVIPKNSEGSEELNVAIEYGIKAHWAINAIGYKIIAGLVTREVPMADDGADIRRSQAEASHTSIFAGVALPIGW